MSETTFFLQSGIGFKNIVCTLIVFIYRAHINFSDRCCKKEVIDLLMKPISYKAKMSNKKLDSFFAEEEKEEEE